jgi:hypothetical protein
VRFFITVEGFKWTGGENAPEIPQNGFDHVFLSSRCWG